VYLSRVLVRAHPTLGTRPVPPTPTVLPAGKGHVPADLLRMADDCETPGRVPRDFWFRQLVSSLHFDGDPSVNELRQF
jgi:hypothetical protein